MHRPLGQQGWRHDMSRYEKVHRIDESGNETIVLVDRYTGGERVVSEEENGDE